ncbi:hypothetical protein FOPG_08868 [Fusarium oxysporum f. sp. conglutinans race 2 54008]|uniref:Uncharacterized protein n=1 Tax=Fusarium oxysporum f. sp. conglutinans race 2 54008 TaxID=1089457 RepID=X0HJ30_FUSOX|nr:hypothetical protein FOPG_08868 [Fusarium oxysporum f. sp. conglutinans race 2 54008]
MKFITSLILLAAAFVSAKPAGTADHKNARRLIEIVFMFGRLSKYSTLLVSEGKC